MRRLLAKNYRKTKLAELQISDEFLYGLQWDGSKEQLDKYTEEVKKAWGENEDDALDMGLNLYNRKIRGIIGPDSKIYIWYSHRQDHWIAAEKFGYNKNEIVCLYVFIDVKHADVACPYGSKYDEEETFEIAETALPGWSIGEAMGGDIGFGE